MPLFSNAQSLCELICIAKQTRTLVPFCIVIYGIVLVLPYDAGWQFFGVAVYGYIAAPLPQPAQKLCGKGNAVSFREFLEHGGGDEFACFEVFFRFVEPLLFSEFFFGVLLCDALLLGGSFLLFLFIPFCFGAQRLPLQDRRRFRRKGRRRCSSSLCLLWRA